jgi:oligopeptide transport system substrate-binding protein
MITRALLFAWFFFSVNIYASSESKLVDLKIVFPHIHYKTKWDISNSRSLWAYFINNNIVEPLIRIGASGGYVPSLANAWKYSDNKRKIEFEINSNYKFHNGQKVKPKDIHKSFLKIFKEKITSHSDITNAISINGEYEESIKLKGDRLSIELKTPLNGLLFNLSTPEYGIVPESYYKKALQEIDKNDLKNLSGPYQLISFEEKRIQLKAFTQHKYFSHKIPQRVDIVEITDLKDSIDYYNMNKDVVLIGSDYSSSIRLKNIKGKRHTSSFALTEFLVPNRRSLKFKKKDQFDKIMKIISFVKKDLEVDPNLAQLTDQLFTEDNIARLRDLKKPSSKGAKDFNDKVLPLSQKIELKMVVFDWMKYSPIPEQLKIALAKFNIKLVVDIVEVKDLKELIEKRPYDILYIYSGVSALDPIVELIYLSRHPLIDLNFNNESLMKFIDRAKVEPEKDEYIKLLKSIHKKILDDGVLVPLFHCRMTYLTNSKYNIKNTNHFDGGLELWNWEHNERE